MKISENWLREWVNPKIDQETLSEQLTMLGLEVDDVSPASGEFSKVIVAEIISADKHPDADKLKVCQVKINETETKQIVCGAPNARVGLNAPLALIGAKLPGGFKIKKSKLRGVESHGMLCSQVELGLSDDHSGLMELPTDANIGESIFDYLNLNDSIIDIDLTPNRADCFCIKGVARDIACLNQNDMDFDPVSEVKSEIPDTMKVSISAKEECPKYLSRIVKGVDITKSTPLWMIEKLRRSGIRSINPAVDVTNYVMLELGQPMHAFDHNQINGSIHVQMANQGEKLTLLDGKEIELGESYLMISDEKDHLALAGIMGGLNSGVTDETTDLVLEAAYFNPANIMGKTRDLGVFTESALRFERGVDFKLQTDAMHRATELIIEICGGQAGPINEVVSETDLPKLNSILLTKDKVNRVLGFEVENSEITRIFNSLGLESTFETDQWRVNPASHRFDIAIAEDLIEEIVRMVGYDKMPADFLNSEDHIVPIIENNVPTDELKIKLNNLGYNEVINYSFISEKDLKNVDQRDEGISLKNPLTEEFAVMRTSLLPGMLKTINYNLRRQNSRLKLYETGNVFKKEKTIIESDKLIAIWAGERHPESWSAPKELVDYFDLKGDLEKLLFHHSKSIEFSESNHKFLHPGRQANVIINEINVGWIGQIHPQIAKIFSIKKDVYATELFIENVNNCELPLFEPISKFPSVRRDLAVVLPNEISYTVLENLIRDKVGNTCKEVIIFDEYKGDNLEANSRSLAIGIILQNKNATFEDKDVDKIISEVVSSIASKLGAEIRGGSCQ